MLSKKYCSEAAVAIFRAGYRALLLGSLLMSRSDLRAADNMHFHGALTAQPCSITPEEANVPLDFGDIIAKDLYKNQRTPGKTLELNLKECNIEVASQVTVTFRGAEDSQLPGLLALAPESQASGIAIGMEMPDGHAVALNKPTDNYALTNGDNIITLQVYVQGEPQAISQKAITPGVFNAIATFDLEYQ
jgi:type 1 fimbria pilin